MERGTRRNPPKGTQQPGRGLSNAQTRNSNNPNVSGSSSGDRGGRQDPPKGFRTFGRGLSGTQTRNSPGPKVN